MANGTKVYTIKINGIQESTTELDNLLKVLDNIEARMSDLGKSGSGGGASSTMAGNSKAADELVNKYEKLNELIGGQRDGLIEVNRLIKEATKAREADAAAERLLADNYGNTMAGLKQQLADVKSAMQFAEIGSDDFNTLTKAADELNTKLKQIEESYGQFGRNVGNYKSAAEGFKGVTIAVGGVERQFKNTTVATRSMEKELQALEIEGKQNTQEYKDLSEAFHNYKMALDKAKASVDDLKATSKGMDKMLDLGQSLGALSQISNGFSAFFGNDSDIQRSIQSLVGLQNAMKGIETLRKQMNTEEGFGSLFKNGNEAIDKFVKKLFGVKDAASGASVANESLAVSEGAVATGSKTAAVGVQTLSTAQKAATVSAKALGVALKAVGIGLILEAVAQLTEYIKPLTNKIGELRKNIGTLALNEAKAATGMDEMIEADERYLAVQKNVNNQLNDRVKYIESLRSGGQITDDEASSLILESKLKAAQATVKALKAAAGDTDFGKQLNDKWIHPTEKMVETLDKSFDESGKDIRSFGERFKDTINEWTGGTSSVNQAMNGIVTNFVKRFEEATRLMEVDSAKGQKAIRELREELATNKFLNTAFSSENANKWLSNDVIEYLQKIKNLLFDIKDETQDNAQQIAESLIKENKTGVQKAKENLEALQNASEKTDEIIAAIPLAQKKIAEEQRKALDAERAAYKKRVDAQNNFYDLKVKAMKDGLTKTLAQLDRERDAEIRKARENAVNVSESISIINQMYDQKVYDAKKKWADDIEEVYINLERDLFNIESDAYARQVQMQRTRLEGMSKNWSEYLGKAYNLSRREMKSLREDNELLTSPNYIIQDSDSKQFEITFKYRIQAINQYWKERLEMEKKNREKNINDETELFKKERNIAKKEENSMYKDRKKLLDKQLSDTFSVIMKEVNAFQNAEVLKQEDWRESQVVSEKVNEAIEKASEKGLETTVKSLEELKRAYIEVTDSISLNESNHKERMRQIDLKYDEDVKKASVELKNAQINDTKEAYDEMIKEKMDFLQYINSMDVIPDTTSFGILKISELKDMYTKQKAMYKDLLDSLTTLREKARADWSDENGIIISQEGYDNAIKEINQIEASVTQGMNVVKENSRNIFGEYIASINQYVQLFGQAIQDVMSMVWDLEDSNYDRMMEQLDEYIDKYEERRQKLEDITRQHAENINSIETKLQTARGDRRERLIDQLNAEMELRRRSLAEEKKAEKEKEALEAKKDKLDKENKEKQKKRDLQAAIIAGALATAQGYATAPWIPMGVLQGSIAAALTAVQVALIRRTKYAEGGLLQGKSHSEGGIPVLGGRAEVEGNEFVTNKKTTMQNLPLMEYINSKKRRLDISDFIEFYGKPARANVQRVTTKFAQGGQLPVLRDDVAVADRLASIVEAYAQRPVYVSVQEITSKQNDVKNVQVLAGLE